MRFPGSQLGSTLPCLPPSNGFAAVQMDTKFRTFTMIEPDHEGRADPPSPWHSNLQVEDDRSPTVSVHLCTPPLRADMRTDLQSTGFEPSMPSETPVARRDSTLIIEAGFATLGLHICGR